MTAMGLGFAWLVAANVLAMLPSRDNLWTRAYVLIAIGIPLLGYITYTNGPLLGMAFLVAGCSVLRWPVIYLGRWIRRMMAKTES
ncbi:MAG TPA: hypothetical protein DIT67_02205 [Octadecabacter sp.]|nr:hypothetical protein [Octadecabacter sp.]